MRITTNPPETGYGELPRTPVEAVYRQTPRVYDYLAPFYPLSSWLFHSQAHRAALRASNIQNGTRVLEVATGSGEMLKHLVKLNPDGETIGVDISPRMAAQSQANGRRRFPDVRLHCPAADARWLPFASASFDTVICCYLFELVPQAEMANVLIELSRVLRSGGNLVTVLVGQNRPSFNVIYKLCSKVAPAFWGRQVGEQLANLLGFHGYVIQTDHHVRQIYYSSRIISATQSRSVDPCK